MTDNTKSTLTAEQVQQFIPFDELSESAIADLLPHFRLYSVPARRVMFKRVMQDNECHFLLSGRVELADSQFEITQICIADPVNILSFDGSHAIYSLAAMTKTDCTLFAVSRQHL